MTCEFCAITQGAFESEQLYEDDKVSAVLHLKPAAPGHVLIFTKEHFPILEQVPDFIIGHVFSVANKLSTAIFESLGAQGTNIIIENGTASGQLVPHFALHIIPRQENDGLQLDWQPKKAADEEMDIAFTQIKEQAENVHPSGFEKEKQEVAVEKEEKIVVSKDSVKLKQLRRIP